MDNTEFNPRAVIGDNSHAAIVGRIDGFKAKLEKFQVVSSEADASAIRDLGKLTHDYIAELEADFKERKAPHEQKINDLKAVYRPFNETLIKLKESCRSLLTAFLQEQQRQADIKAAAALKAQQDADALAASAAAKANETGHIFDQMDATDAAYAAEVQQVDTSYAERVAMSKPSIGSASGIAKAASLRTTWGAKVIDGPKLVRHYAKRAEMIECAKKLAAAEMRATKGQAIIPGAEAESIEKAV